MLASGGLGAMSLRDRASPSRSEIVAIPGSDFVVSRPSGFDTTDTSMTATVVPDTAGPRPDAVMFRALGEATLFVVHMPNVASIDAASRLPANLAEFELTDQFEFAHVLGSAREITAKNPSPLGVDHMIRSTFVVADTSILVVGMSVPNGDLDAHAATYDQFVASMRRALDIEPAHPVANLELAKILVDNDDPVTTKYRPKLAAAIF